MSRVWLLSIVWVGLLWGEYAVAQSDLGSGQPSHTTVGPNTVDQGSIKPNETNSGRISILPASSLPAQPLTSVSAEPLPDMTADVQLEPYLDGLFAGLVSSGRIAGAAVAIVRDGRVVLNKGYGFANLEARTPVDPSKTLFRVASLSKVVTALAVMGQVDDGKLDLNSDVNVYLKDFKLAPFGPESVTLANLLTHTGGFDDRYLEAGAPLGGRVEALGPHLARRMPPRVMPAGKVLSYSNYGYALAGFLAEQTSGQDFRALVKTRVFDSLSMTRSSFGVPEPVPTDMATPYLRTENGMVKARFDKAAPYPAGDLVATSGDLSRLMVALVNDGAGVVKPETLAQMRLPQFTPGVGPDAWGFGFALGESNGVKWFGHGGALPGFAAELRLNADTRSGFVVLMNTDNSFGVVQPILVAIEDRIWPRKPVAPTFDHQTAQATADKMAGTYIPNMRVRGDFLALGAGPASLTLKSGQGATIAVTSSVLPLTLNFQPLTDGQWFEPTYRWRLSPYKVEGVIADGLLLGPFAYERSTFTQNFDGQKFWLILSATIIALAVVVWATGFASQRLFGEPVPVIPVGARLVGFVAAVTAMLFFVGVLGALEFTSAQDVWDGRLGMLPVVLSLPYVLLPLTIAAMVFAAIGFGSGFRARSAQVAYGSVVLALLMTLWFVWAWNLHILAR